MLGLDRVVQVQVIDCYEETSWSCSDVWYYYYSAVCCIWEQAIITVPWYDVLWYCKYFKAFNKDYFCIIFCSAAMWDSVWCFFFFFYSIFLPYLFSPSNFFLLMIWNVRCLNGQHDSLMLIFGVENTSSLQWYQSEVKWFPWLCGVTQ